MYNSSVLKISNTERRYILALKGVAIFCVVCAHLYPVPSQTGEINQLMSDILHYVGSMGVPVFFMISGFLFAGNKKNFSNFLKERIKTVFLPWVFCYTLLYFYVSLRKPGTISYLSMLLGYQSSAYYLTVLIMMYIIFWKRCTTTIVYFLMTISLVSIISTGWTFGIHFLNDIFGTYFLNPLNWTLFFGSGILLRKNKKQLFALSDGGWDVFLLCLMSYAYFSVSHMMNEPIFYFSRFAILGHAINMPMLFGIAKIFSLSKGTLLEALGIYSFPIYLLHQLFAGAIIMTTNLCENPLVTAARPFFVIGIVLISMRMMYYFFGNSAPALFACIGVRNYK